MCRIMTSNYKNCVTENGISISGDRGRSAGFTGLALPELAPKKEFWQVWHNSLGKIPKEASDKYYVKEYYRQVLSKLDPKEVLKKIPDGSILLCYEKSDEFCHRHLVAFWFELFLGISSSEVIENPKRETVCPIILESCFSSRSISSVSGCAAFFIASFFSSISVLRVLSHSLSSFTSLR